MDGTQSDRPRLTVVVPVFNEAATIAPFLARIVPLLQQAEAECDVAAELLFVDDGSRDETARVLLDTRLALPFSLVRLSRNFGKEAAVSAGLAQAGGEGVIVMDVDLQDPPDLIPRMVREWRAGAPVVLTRRRGRPGDSFAKRNFARAFYRVHNRISSTKIPENVPDFRLMDRAVVDAVNSLPENRRFNRGLFAWVGYEPVVLDFTREERVEGVSKYSPRSQWRYAMEGITSFSTAPLTVWTYIGSAIATSAMLYGLYILLRTLIWGRDSPGFASLFVAITFLGGIQLLGIGILGEYLGRVYSEAKRRPPYVIARRHDIAPKKPAGEDTDA